jgi:hypothetical protein
VGLTKNLAHLLELARPEDKFPGVISFRKLRPIWAIPKGSFRRIAWSTLSKLTNIPWAVSGRR